MKDWLDSPIPGYTQRREAEYWCPRCQEPFVAVERFDNESGGYYSDSLCPYCEGDGIPREEVHDDGPGE